MYVCMLEMKVIYWGQLRKQNHDRVIEPLQWQEILRRQPGCKLLQLIQITRVYFLILKPCGLILRSVHILFEVSINYVAHCNVMVTEHNE